MGALVNIRGRGAGEDAAPNSMEVRMGQVDGGATLNKITWRLIPFLFLLYIVAYLDRVNVGFAKLQMQPLLHFNEAIYGTAAGIFFLGYFLFEIPSNLLLERFGARRWITRIMVTWGLVAMAMMFIHTPFSFYALRFLLGVAEAGFFPGVILYLTYWFTSAERARIIALFMTATSLSGVIGSPLSGALLGLHKWSLLGLHTEKLMGWQWLFLLEGLPAVLLGFVVLAYLPDKPERARWLKPEEKAWIAERLRLEQETKHARHGGSLLTALRNPNVWLICLIYLMLTSGGYVLSFFSPTIIKASGHLKDSQVGLLNAIPSLIASVGMVLIAIHSDRTRERRLHVAASALLAAFGFLLAAYLAAYVHSTALLVVALSMAGLGVSGMLGPFWSIPIDFLPSSIAAVGIAFINSVGNLGGQFGPQLVGKLVNDTHSYSSAFVAMTAALLIATIVATLLRPDRSSHSSRS